jgi:uncharacterized protein (DUF1697 family)
MWIALLRGINVGGQRIVKMEDLRASFEALGFQRVKTYVQSGNVTFDVVKAHSNNMSKSIEGKIKGDCGFPVLVVLRTLDEMKKIVRDNPFFNERGIDYSKLHVTFLSAFPTKTAWGNLDALNAHPDQFRAKDQEVYLYCPDGHGRTKLSNTALEKLLLVKATTRNWKTVNKLAEMSSE